MTSRKKLGKFSFERLEPRFAPSSLLPNSGGRSASRDKQALEITNAEQAAYYLAAITLLGQHGNISSVITSTIAQHHEKTEDSTYPQTREVRPDDPPPFPGAVLIAVQFWAEYPEGCRSGYLYEWFPPDILTSIAQPIGYVVATGERLPSYKHTLQIPSLQHIDVSSHGIGELDKTASISTQSSSEAQIASAPTSTAATETSFGPDQGRGSSRSDHPDTPYQQAQTTE